MPKNRTMKIVFPFRGQNRERRYGQERPPFTAQRAVNVRGFDAIERRERGGSRPGLIDFLDIDFGSTITAIQKVAYVDNSGNLQVKLVVIADGNMNIVDSSARTTTISYLTDPDGNNLTVNGDNIIFTSTVAAVSPLGDTDAFQLAEHDGRVYIADSTLRRYEPRTGAIQPMDNAPTNQPLVSVYRERIVLSGENHIVYFSRQGKPNDWNIGDNPDDIGRATIDYAGDNSVVGGTVTFQIAWGRKAFIYGHADGLYVIYGNPGGGGSKETVSESVGPIAPQAGCIADGMFIFLGRDGLYTWAIGSNSLPERISEVIPDSLRDVATTTNDIIMRYDKKNAGVHLFITPATGDGNHWWIDLKNRALWPVKFGLSTLQPIAAGVLPLTGDSDVVFGCKDGYLRRFSNAKTTDDGTAIASAVGIGPLHISGDDGMDGQVMEIVSELGTGSANVTWALVPAKSAEEASDRFETDLDAVTTTNVNGTGTWVANRNPVRHPRSRGPWCVLWLSSVGRWAYESVQIQAKQTGRLR